MLYTPEAQSAYRWRQDVRYADQEEGGDNGDWYGEEEEEAEGCDDGGEACHPQTDPSPSPDDPSSFPEVWKEDGGGSDGRQCDRGGGEGGGQNGEGCAAEVAEGELDQGG